MEAFDADAHNPLPGPTRKVLITGAAGRIGSFIAPRLSAHHDLTLGHQHDDDLTTIAGYGHLCEIDLNDIETLHHACQGIDTVVHLAALPSPQTSWPEASRVNINGTYNVYEAAMQAACRRVVFASSIHAVSGYQAGRQVRAEDPVNPGDIYGVSKCFGEALARYAADQRGLSSICIRIGAFQPLERAEDEDALPLMDAFVSRRDLAQLISRCVADEHIRFAIVHGLSNNCFNRLDISSARELLGYKPEDDFTDLNPALADLHLSERVRPHNERELQ